jgi:NADH-quinone oxidoreductase subunit N
LELGLFIPEIVLAATAVAVILLDLFTGKKGWLAVLSLAGIAVSIGFAASMWNGHPQGIFNGLVAADNFAVFFKLLFLSIAAMVILVSVDYVNKMARFRGEYHALLLLATLGMMMTAAATDLISVFIALELTAVCFYLLAGFLKDNPSTEASLKYLLLGGVASAVLLYGMALVFGFTGETRLADIARTVVSSGLTPGLILGMVLLIAGFGFKIAAVPFQMWVPDVYEGAPTPVTLYLSVGSKVAGFAVIVRLFFTAFAEPVVLSLDWGQVFAVLAAIGMTLGNILAIQQGNIKRMLAYSGIAHSGYIMVGLATLGLSAPGDIIGRSSILFYIVAFALADLGAFAAVIAISNKIGSDLIKGYTGIGRLSPILAIAMTLCLVSLTGLPPAVGFIAKFYIFSGAASNGLLWLVIIAALNSAISAYYYFRVARLMWLGKPEVEGAVPSSPALRLVLGVSAVGLLVLGIAPALMIKVAEAAARLFTS